LQVVGKDIKSVKLAVSGAGAAALACVDLLVDIGLPRENVWLTDLAGVVYTGRKELMDPEKERFAQPTNMRTLAEVIVDADIFLGLSAGGVLKPHMVATMKPRPLILALANPTPEILPEEVAAVRSDAVMATGRTDYPNQVNNVLCFPYIFRGALDVGATTITRAMEIAAVHAIANLARQEQNDIVASAYNTENLTFGPQYIIPKPFDPRLIVKIAPAVAKAAIESGVATRPIQDFDTYEQKLQQFVYHSGTFMQPVFAAARGVAPERSRIIFAEGEEERVLRAAQILVDEKLARPVLIGRRGVIDMRIKKYGLRLKRDEHFVNIDPENDPRYREYWEDYRRLMGRQGVTAQYAKLEMRRRSTLIASMLLKKGEGDGMICGTSSSVQRHLRYVDRVLGHASGASVYATMSALVLPGRQIFIVDTHVNLDPTAEQLAEITVMAAEGVRRFGIEPKVALISHSNFGSSDAPSAQKMRRVLDLVRARAPQLEIDGEMHGDSALDEATRKAALPETTLTGAANLLVLPNLDAANISYNLLKTAAGQNVAIGPILLGCAAPVNILTPAVTVRRLVNMAALTVVQTLTPSAAEK
jgi:malate dehydrogenase (oxaloacetate-decarboxylating)(NADP+)